MTIINDVHLELSRCVDAVIKLRQQNAALLAALEEIAVLDRHADPGEPWQYGSFGNMARRAIALAKGEKP